MLYGHVEKAYHRIDHLLRLRELQDQTGGFQVFIPLAFHPENTKLSDLKKPSALMNLRTMAISRLCWTTCNISRLTGSCLGSNGTNRLGLWCR